MMSAVATTNAMALMIAITHAVSAFCTPARAPVSSQDDDREQAAGTDGSAR